MRIDVVLLWGIAGALLAETAKQRQKWTSLSEKKFRAQFRSVKFWCTVAFLMASGAVAAYFLFEDSSRKLSAFSCFAAGAGAQALIRNLAASGSAGKGKRFGFGREEFEAPDRVSWKDILS